MAQGFRTNHGGARRRTYCLSLHLNLKERNDLSFPVSGRVPTRRVRISTASLVLERSQQTAKSAARRVCTSNRTLKLVGFFYREIPDQHSRTQFIATEGAGLPRLREMARRASDAHSRRHKPFV